MYQRLIDEKFPRRKSKAQKAAFRFWLTAELEGMGYPVREEVNGSNVNLVCGDPEGAQIIWTSHYDTPAKRLWPDWHFPRNPGLSLAYQAVQAVWMAGISLIVMLGMALITGSGRLGLWMFVAAFLSQIALMLAGPATRKKHGSGLAMLLEEMAKLPPEKRQGMAVIFWDNSCKGLLGSRAWAKAHPQAAYTTLVVNVDALSPSGDWLVMPSRLARSLPAYADLEKALRERWGDALRCYSGLGCVRISDESAFRSGVILTRCRKAPGIGYWTQAG